MKTKILYLECLPDEKPEIGGTIGGV